MNGTLTSATINGRYVAPYTFYNQSSLSEVVTNVDLLYVDDSSFRDCTSITTSTINFSKIKFIGDGAFYSCSGLSGTLDLSSAVYIGPHAFSYTNISEIILGYSICVLEDTNAIPSSVTAIKVPSDSVDRYKAYPVWSKIADKIVSK